ncbi:methyl-accepting chemotaxis protein [Pelomonas sp. SE-A7]|uniref:methyl-accepting chemotaxis protein n=1 Tax=Pelomonas sp. SE-A7 TaxID=3054953 RepID=UPI00259D1FEA|nr:methyl-accepting chemotaxis protein [Pelomonas sp. SE-A7]MDM4765058.1 methyl-accepting chemotaxis protein [Pelomonas sp. SE-A7]
MMTKLLTRLQALSSLRLSGRLTAGFGLVLLLLLLTMAAGLLGMHRMSEQTRQIVEVAGKRSDATQAMMNAANDTAVALYGFLLVTDEVDAKTQTEQFESALKQYETAAKSLQGLMGEQPDEATTALLKQLDDAGSPARTMARNAVRMVSMGGNASSAFSSMDPRVAINEWRTALVKLLAHEAEVAAGSYAEAQASYAAARTALVLTSLLGLAVGAVATWLILRSVTGPLRQAIAEAQRIATGDLGAEIDASRKDETGELLAALASMQEQLRSLVGAIRSSTDSIAHASAEIAHGNLDLSQRTERTAAELQRAAGATAQLSQTVRGATQAAEAAGVLAHGAESVAQRGGAAVGEVVQTMGRIDASARQISDIIGVIDSIAFQTNILALNAAVEAARAGEQGRGFAVVASEVRALAQRSADAAKQIKSLINDSSERVAAGSRQVEQAGATMKDIVTSVLELGQKLQGVTRSSAAQNEGIGQLESMVGALDQMTQSNAALVEQGAAAAESLRQQAAQLAETVARFRLSSETE